MRNNETRWEDTADRLDNRLDGVLLFPPLIYGAGLLQRDGETLGWALAIWAVAVLVWTPWIIIRVAFRAPPGDVARATAFLGLGLLPWAAVLLDLDALRTRTGLVIAFPLVFLWSAGAMILAVLERPRLARWRRAAFLAAGALIYAVFGFASFGALAVGLGQSPITAAVCVGVGGAAAIAALSLVYRLFADGRAATAARPRA